MSEVEKALQDYTIILRYRFWYDTCTRTFIPGWEEKAAKASIQMDALENHLLHVLQKAILKEAQQ